MKINVVELGGGLTRLDIQPSACEPRNIPTSIADDIMRDVIRHEKNHGCCTAHRFEQPRDERGRFVSTRPCPPTPNREPDGIDIHVDRPLRENYGGVQWAAENAFRKDLANYRSLEALAKKCDWPAREPMKGAPNYRNLAAERPRTQCVGVPAPMPLPRPLPRTCGCSDKMALREAIGALAAIVEHMA